jgi:hypothetical protein
MIKNIWPSILDVFLAKDNESLCTPFSWEKWTGATNGHIAVRIPRIGIDKAPPSSLIYSLPWEPTQSGEWVDLPAYELPVRQLCPSCYGSGRVHPCPECDGAGEVQWSTGFNDYSDDCKTCHGAGHVPGEGEKCTECDGERFVYANHEMPVGFCKDEYDINAFLLEKIKKLPGVKLYTAHINGMFHFRFDGGEGMLMGMRI